MSHGGTGNIPPGPTAAFVYGQSKRGAVFLTMPTTRGSLSESSPQAVPGHQDRFRFNPQNQTP